MTPDDMMKIVKSQRDWGKRYFAPRISDYVWYGIGKLQRTLLTSLDKFMYRASSATWKIQKYRAIVKDYDRRVEIAKETYDNGGCAR